MRRAAIVSIAVAATGCYFEVEGRPRPAHARQEREAVERRREQAVRDDVQRQLEGATRYAAEHAASATPPPEPPHPAAPVATPVRTAEDATWLSVGQRETCVVVAGGKVRCWSVSGGELSWLSGMRRVSTGFELACAVGDDRSVLCWGLGAPAEGEVTLDARARRIALPGPADVVAIGAGWFGACAVRATGAVACWGRNAKGALGDGTTRSHREPVAVPGVTDAVDVVGGEDFFCALRKDGSVSCWGDGSVGQLGQGAVKKEAQRPVAVKGLANVVSLAAGRMHACAAREDGHVLCWGMGGGNGLHDVPTVVSRVSEIVEIAAGESTTCARTKGGEVSCWGDFSVPPPSRPRSSASRPAPRIEDAVQIGVGIDNVCARRANGAVSCFGR